MVVDRQKGQKQIRVQGVQSGREAGRIVRQTGTESRNRQGSKPGGLEKGEKQKEYRKNMLIDFTKHTRRTGTERQETQG
jgi:hypothetical protein